MTLVRYASIALALAAAMPAFAAPRMTDSQFVQASRCRALVKAPDLGAADPAAFDALIKSQRQGRADYIVEKAADAISAAGQQARRADEAGKESLIAERDGPCQALLATR